MSRQKIVGQSQNMKTANMFSENVKKLKYLKMTPINRIHKEITHRMTSGNACCRSDLHLSSFFDG
jgi:hypothetical protein